MYEPKVVDVVCGTCATCAKPAIGAVGEFDFIEYPTGKSLDMARVEGHCGRPGHNMYMRYITREEFEAEYHA